jgi:hypothetical protein
MLWTSRPLGVLHRNMIYKLGPRNRQVVEEVEQYLILWIGVLLPVAIYAAIALRINVTSVSWDVYNTINNYTHCWI